MSTNPLDIIQKIDPETAWPGLRLLMVSTTGDQSIWLELDRELDARRKGNAGGGASRPSSGSARTASRRCATVLFMGGAGGSLRAGVTENPVNLTRSVRQAMTRVTCGGAPVYVWPGGGITFMVDVTRLPETRLRLCADAGTGGADRIHHAARGLCRARRPHGFGARCRRAASRSSNKRQESWPHADNPWPLDGESVRVTGPVRPACRGDRLHLQHGPIDLIVAGRGPSRSGRSAPMTPRWTAFPDDPAEELVAELPVLRSAARRDAARPHGAVALRMAQACWPYRDRFITPMAAVAGSVAEEIGDDHARCRIRAPAHGQQWRRYRLHLGTKAKSMTVGVAAISRPPGHRRHDPHHGERSVARRRHLRLARAQPEPRHRRCRHGAGARCRRRPMRRRP